MKSAIKVGRGHRPEVSGQETVTGTILSVLIVVMDKAHLVAAHTVVCCILSVSRPQPHGSIDLLTAKIVNGLSSF